MAQAYMTETGTAAGARRRSPLRLPAAGAPASRAGADDRGIWRRGIVLAALAVLLALVMILHAADPQRGSATSAASAETFLPWLGLFVPVLLVLALLRRSATALIALLLPAIVWLNLFGGLLTDKSGSGGDLTVATHNVNADNPDPAGTARDVAASGRGRGGAGGADRRRRCRRTRRRWRTRTGTTRCRARSALWSKYPLSGHQARRHQAGLDRARCAPPSRRPSGEVAVYVAHLPSVRVKFERGLHRQPARQQRGRAGRGHRRRAAGAGSSCSAT